MTEQHRADPDLWAAAERWGANTMDMANCILELRSRLEALEATQHAHIEAKAAEADIKAAELEWARTAPGMRSDDLRPPAADAQRKEAAEAGARCAVEQLRSTPGSWQPIRNFTADEVAPIVVPTAADARQLTLVERVARRLARFASEGRPGDDATPIASAVLCDVADWLAEGSGRSGSWNTPAADLRHEASR